MPKSTKPSAEIRGMIVDTDGATPTIYLYDDIGPSWAGMIDGKSFQNALQEIGAVDQIDVRVNSNGGSVFEATAIFNLLRDNAAEITIKIDSIAASAASVIAMAGDRIEIASNAMIMIHEASTICWGNKAEMDRVSSLLGKVDGVIVNTYVERTGSDTSQVEQWLAAETWFDADEAIEYGFADAKFGAIANQTPRVPQNRFKNVPKSVKQYEQTGRFEMRKPSKRPPAQPVDRNLSTRIAAARARYL